jgi:hypothetical protein
LIVSGYAITASGFLHRLSTEQSLPRLELTWGFETINVAMITVGFFPAVQEYSAGGTR